MNKIVVVGIHTGVGKTVVSAMLTEALQATYWKPVQCGLPTDRTWVESHLSGQSRTLPEHIILKTPCSPHLAARKDKTLVLAKDLILPSASVVSLSLVPKTLIIEGTGGLLSPLNEKESWIDAALQWGKAKWVLVHRHYLGSLNHFLLSIEALKARGIPLYGVVFNGSGDKKTEEMLLERGKTMCLGRLKKERRWTPALLQQRAQEWKGALITHGL